MQGHYLGDMGLNKDDAALGVDAGGQPVQHHGLNVGLDLGAFFRGFNGGQGVDVYGTVDAVVILLQANPVLQRPQVVAKVKRSGRAHPGEYDAPVFLVRSHGPSTTNVSKLG